MTALPPILSAGEFSPFKFWFNGNVWDGVHYRSELFYRLYSAEASRRAAIYHLACKLFKENAVIVTVSDEQCSIWLSLRNPGLLPIVHQRIHSIANV